MKSQRERLEIALAAVGISGLGLGLVVWKYSGSLIASAATALVVIALLALLLRGFFTRWALEQYAENPNYRATVLQHIERRRSMALGMPVLAILLGLVAYVADLPLVATIAGMAAGLPILWLSMKSAFETVTP